MRTHPFIAIVLATVLSLVSTAAAAESTENPLAIISTSKGDITVELFPQQAPLSVANFIRYAQSGFYDGTVFHRVIKRFMIQGGGFNKDMARKTTFEPVANESKNGLRNNRWTLAMARTMDPDSATAQFFINVNMNSSLDAGSGKLGYSVFGQVIDGQYVVQAIEKVPVQSSGRFANLPIEPVIIEKVSIKRPAAMAPVSVEMAKPIMLKPKSPGTTISESNP
ncbi:MAG: peptidyl-prolyl cis-trans isomerase A (cyclophilin A) [Paraglaciecola psychrophila]|jgi:peptidyl-prolyl cis-trans isomerase A (cyclophilin A)